MLPLLRQDPHRIGRPPGAPAADRVPDHLAAGTPQALRDELAELVGAADVHGRASDLVRYASDASPYRLVPQVVVTPRTVDQVGALLRYCTEIGRRAVFRAAGTSLCGQSQCDDVLIDVRLHWGGMVVEQGGERLRVRPGTILAHANAVLARHGRRLGPDPASASACTVGGAIANNAAGMRCTPQRSAYATLRHVTFVLPSGTVINTEDADAEQRFQVDEPALASGLMALRAEILADPDMRTRIERKYSMRNTTGYTVRAFLDGDTPLGIFRRLLVGSEGTLGFIAEAVLDTVPIPPVIGVGWLHLPSVTDAVRAVPALKALGAEAVELLMATSLIGASAQMPHTPTEWASLPADGASLLIEFGAADPSELAELEAQVQIIAKEFEVLHPVSLSTDSAFSALSWLVRSSLNSDLARNRPVGAANVNEDVCFPVDRLAEAVLELSAMLSRYGYPPTVAGHAAFGNMHFTMTPRLGDPAELAAYGRFMDELTDMVVGKYDGSLKAEHGTGINMAPFVEREWGPQITDVMRRVRRLVDPNAVLGPDVLLTDDSGVHLKRMKSDPRADAIIDTCIDCGFCEPVCPSRNVTTTPRQRIALRREMARQPDGSPVLQALQDEYQYDAIETCAADASCAVACPYDINTGALMKEFRVAAATPARDRVALTVAKNWGRIEKAARLLIAAADGLQHRIGYRRLGAVTDLLRKVVSSDLMPTIPGPMPKAAKRALPDTVRAGAAAVYFPACVNRIFGRDPDCTDDRSLPEALVEVSDRAGAPVWIPADVAGKCCGTIWSSKGYQVGRDYMCARTARAVLSWTDEGTLPLVVDAASCTHALLADLPAHLPPDLRDRYRNVRILDATSWGKDLLATLTVDRKLDAVTVHPGCSLARLGLTGDLLEVARAIAEDTHVPYGSNCCGTAGDRGLLHPELVVSATREERRNLPDDSAAYLAANRTCEMGLRQATGHPFESVVFALEERTRPNAEGSA